MDEQTVTATIMAVDDAPENLNLIREMLQNRGYRVLAFPRGREALNAAVKNPPDLILLDIMMPELNGFEVCERLKSYDALKDVPVLFLTALADLENKVNAFRAGGIDYVTKPFQYEEVNARVAAHLHLRKMKLELEKHNHRLEEMVVEKTREISDAQMATLMALSKLAEYRDDETGHHIERSASFCRILAERLKSNPRYSEHISDNYVKNLFHAAPLHDIGKVGIPDSILLKPGNLTPNEFEIIKTHTEIGAKTLQSVYEKHPTNAFINMGIAIAHAHHEKWDGSGYPLGLRGENIPLSARIMALADVYDALRSRRTYKEPYTHEKSCGIILDGTGKHFDPAVIDAFKAVQSEFATIRHQTGL